MWFQVVVTSAAAAMRLCLTAACWDHNGATYPDWLTYPSWSRLHIRLELLGICLWWCTVFVYCCEVSNCCWHSDIAHLTSVCPTTHNKGVRCYTGFCPCGMRDECRHAGAQPWWLWPTSNCQSSLLLRIGNKCLHCICVHIRVQLPLKNYRDETDLAETFHALSRLSFMPSV